MRQISSRGARLRWVVVVSLAVLLLVGSVLYIRLGWTRTDNYCNSQTGNPEQANFSQSFSLIPPGFTCDFGDRRATSLWFPAARQGR